MSFSTRYGHVTARSALQLTEVDDALRNRLWTLLATFYWNRVQPVEVDFGSSYLLRARVNRETYVFCQRLWHNYFKEAVDTLPNDWKKVYQRLRDHFFHAPWYSVYDFLEFVVKNYPLDAAEKFTGSCNEVLEEEMSGYRFLELLITPITNPAELASVEEAAGKGGNAVEYHLRRALELLADRKNPDYRNSIKESISAVEALAVDVTGKKGTLGHLLKRIDSHVDIHPSLQGAFEKLYGYTSDEAGIRHSLLDQNLVTFEDAKFMLVACSAFVNYTRGKLAGDETGNAT